MTRLETQLVRLKSAAEKVQAMTGAYFISGGGGNPVKVMLSPSEFAMLPGAIEIKSIFRDSDKYPLEKRLTIKGVVFQTLIHEQPETQKDGE